MVGEHVSNATNPEGSQMTTITSSAQAEFSRVGAPASREPSTFRVGLLRGAYLLIFIGQGIRLAPQLFDPSYSWELQRSVVVSMLAAMVLMSLLGLRYPLKMLPVLLFEITWKAVWLLRVALPAAMAGTSRCSSSFRCASSSPLSSLSCPGTTSSAASSWRRATSGGAPVRGGPRRHKRGRTKPTAACA